MNKTEKALKEQKFVIPYSAAYIKYMLLAEESIILANKERMDNYEDTDCDLEIREQIDSAVSEDDYFKLMRKQMCAKNKKLLHDRLLENEDTVTDMILIKLKTTMKDEFVEASVDFLCECSENHCEWILKNYDEIRNPYARSMLCLVFGFRGDEQYVPFLSAKREEFLKNYPGETFEQGASISLCMLQGQKEYLHSFVEGQSEGR